MTTQESNKASCKFTRSNFRKRPIELQFELTVNVNIKVDASLHSAARAVVPFVTQLIMSKASGATNDQRTKRVHHDSLPVKI